MNDNRPGVFASFLLAMHSIPHMWKRYSTDKLQAYIKCCDRAIQPCLVDDSL